MKGREREDREEKKKTVRGVGGGSAGQGQSP